MFFVKVSDPVTVRYCPLDDHDLVLFILIKNETPNRLIVSLCCLGNTPLFSYYVLVPLGRFQKGKIPKWLPQ